MTDRWHGRLRVLVPLVVTGALAGVGWVLARKATANDPWMASEELRVPSRASFRTEHPEFRPDPEDSLTLILPAGEHVFDRTVVVPRGRTLIIEPGTTIRLGPDRSLVSYAPLRALGTRRAPILITARDEGLRWGVVAVVRAGPSALEWVTFEHGGASRIGGLEFRASVTFLEGDVRIRHSIFRDLAGYDGLGVRGAEGIIEENTFRHVRRDGLDLDGGTGAILGNRFYDCGDESIDADSSSRLRVARNVWVGCGAPALP